MGKSNSDNFNEFKRRMEELKKSSSNPNPSIADLIIEGIQLIEADNKSKGEPIQIKVKSSKPVVHYEDNPYICARNLILQAMPVWKRREIESMEKTGNIDNRFYNDFVHEVRLKGDELSS